MKIPFVYCLLAACSLSLMPLAAGQSCGPYGCSSGGSMGWYSMPSYSSPSYEYSSPVIRTSTAYETSSPGSSSYSVGDDGSVLAPNGDKVKSLGGVEIVAKSYAMSRSGESAPSKSASSGQCQCDCGPTLAIMKAQMDRIESKLEQRYGDSDVFDQKQSRSPKAESALARLDAIHQRQQTQLAMR